MWHSDLCSFYKEEVAGETANLVHDRAAVTKRDAATTLRDITNEMIDGITKVRLVLEGQKEKDAWENFMAGYIAYHRLSPRYLLDDVFPDDDC